MQTMTKAELKRRLVPETALTVVNSLMGPCRKLRTVKKVSGNEFGLLAHEKGALSYFRLESNEYVEQTAKGFAIRLKENDRLMVEYEWGHNPLPKAEDS